MPAYDLNLVLMDAVDVTTTDNTTAIEWTGIPTTTTLTGAKAGIVLFQMLVKAVTGTNPTLDIKIEESDDNSTFTQVCTFTQLSGTKATTNLYQQVGIVSKRYLRVAHTIGGSNTPTYNDVSVWAVGLGNLPVPTIQAAAS